MSIPGKLVIAILSAVIVSFVFTYALPGLAFGPLLAACAVSAVAAVLLSHKPLTAPPGLAAGAAASPQPAPGKPAKKQRPAQAAEKPRRDKDAPAKTAPAKKASGGPRERGTVKWFNGSKGFGFIVRENGEEIFVHYRSILGEGRRGLEDGQAVEFRVEHTDKGPQAEDVEGLG